MRRSSLIRQHPAVKFEPSAFRENCLQECVERPPPSFPNRGKRNPRIRIRINININPLEFYVCASQGPLVVSCPRPFEKFTPNRRCADRVCGEMTPRSSLIYRLFAALAREALKQRRISHSKCIAHPLFSLERLRRAVVVNFSRRVLLRDDRITPSIGSKLDRLPEIK